MVDPFKVTLTVYHREVKDESRNRRAVKHLGHNRDHQYWVCGIELGGLGGGEHSLSLKKGF